MDCLPSTNSQAVTSTQLVQFNQHTLNVCPFKWSRRVHNQSFNHCLAKGRSSQSIISIRLTQQPKQTTVMAQPCEHQSGGLKPNTKSNVTMLLSLPCSEKGLASSQKLRILSPNQVSEYSTLGSKGHHKASPSYTCSVPQITCEYWTWTE